MKTFESLKAFDLHLWMMKFSGIWPLKNPSWTYNIRTFLSFFLICTGAGLMLLDAIWVITNVPELSNILYILVTWSSLVFKMILLFYNRRVFWSMLEFLNDPIFMSYPPELDHIMEVAVKEANRSTKALRTLYMYCASFYLIFPFLDGKPVPFPLPFDLGRWSPYMYAFQSTAEYCAAWNNACLDTLAWCIMALAAAQLKVLGAKIELLPEDDIIKADNGQMSPEADKKAIEHLTQCFHHHLAITKYISMVEQILSVGLFFQFSASCICICNSLFDFVVVPFSYQFAVLAEYVLAMVFELFMYCWYGNEIIIQSQTVVEACYMTKWDRYGYGVRKHLFLLMERSKKPLRVRAMKFSTLSLTSFVVVLQWSYSFLALLLKMLQKKGLL